jgi:CHASE2 domain-containing sensor protein
MWTFPRQFAGKGIVASVLSLTPLQARLLLLGLSAVVTLAFCLVFKSGLATFEEQVGALGWKLSPETLTEERINIVAIDEKSIEQIGAWPWSRETYTRLAEALNQAGVQIQLWDIALPDLKEGDDALVTAFQNSNTVLAQAPALQTDQIVRIGALTHAVAGISCTSDMKPMLRFFLAFQRDISRRS